MHIDLGGWTEIELDRTIREASRIEDTGARIAFLSGLFLGLPYRESTLIGDYNTAEVFVINLSGVDCFTFLDYVEAMRLSASFEGFRKNLLAVRYCNSILSYAHRKHFFTDWAEYEPATVFDITEQTGEERTERIIRTLNRKEDGILLLPGIEVLRRTIYYIPSENIETSVLKKLRTGDYAGVLSARSALDVSHVGIIITNENTIKLRHASSDKRFRKVIDQDLQEYLSGKPGLIILRPGD
jgi:hypothetical protein